MKRIFAIFPAIVAAACSGFAMADDTAAIQKKFDDFLPFKANAIVDAPIKGFYQIETDKGIFYASKDGKFIFSGSLHKFEEGLMNLTALRVGQLAKAKLDSIQDQLIVFKAKNEKYRVTVFTDPTCPYCKRLHDNIQGYNDLGITIAYAAFPRGGEGSQMDTILQSIWCAKDRKQAMNEAKNGMTLPPATCKNPVHEMYEIGNSLGIGGTPAIFLKNGQLMPGFMPPDQLLARLKENG